MHEALQTEKTMRVVFFTFLISILSQNIFGQQIDKYIANVDFNNIKNTYKADFQINFSDLKPNDTIKLFLHESAVIASIKSKDENIDYQLKEEKLLGEDNAILIPTNFISENTIAISYSNNLKAIKNPNFKFNPDWIELNIYTSWFPLNINYGLFDYEISVFTDDTLVGTNVSDNSILKSVYTTYDIPFIISNKILKTPVENGKINLFHYGVNDSIIEKVKKKSAKFFTDYTTMFGLTNADNLSIAINSFNRTINYARPQFISSSIDKSYTRVNEKILAHEIGHLWWNKADVGSWEDWLNEGFAEYSSLLLYRNDYGKNEYLKKITAIEKRIKNKPAIWKIEFFNQDRNTVITYKSAYLLFLLENKIGQKQMLDLLKETHQSKIITTDDFLELLSNKCSTEISKWFETGLRK